MDQQNAELEKRLEKLEQEFSDMRKTLDALVQQTAVQTVPKNEKKQKGKLFLRICVPVLILSLLAGGFFYYRASQKPSYAKAEIGDIVTFGRYEQNNSAADGTEPIEWIVLDKQDGQILLLSKYILFTDEFAIYERLNGDFISAVFSSQEQDIISTKTITEGQRLSVAKVFLFSKEEAEQYLPTDKSRKALPSAYCAASKNNASSVYKWWTRSSESNYHFYISENGEIKTDQTLFQPHFGVRPALWLDTTK